MKKLLILTASLFLATSLFAQNAQILRIATFPFSGSVVTNVKEGEYLAGLFTSEFIPLGYTLVTRTTGLKTSSAERSYQTSGATAEIAEIGKQVAADYVMVGDFSNVFGQMSLKVEVIGVESSQIVASETQRINNMNDLDTVAVEMVKNLNSQIKGTFKDMQTKETRSNTQIKDAGVVENDIRYSIGITTPGIGVGILRGKKAKEVTDSFAEDGIEKGGVSMFPLIQLDFLIEFSPYIALETGIGYGMSTVSYSYSYSDGSSKQILKKDGIVIPLMARVQYAFGKISIYASAGPKFIIPISQYATFEYEYEGKNGYESGRDEVWDKNGFLIDLGFALGGEFRVIDSHYIGLRLGYDLNLISPIKKDQRGGEKVEGWYHDNFSASLTYRYKLKKVN